MRGPAAVLLRYVRYGDGVEAERDDEEMRLASPPDSPPVTAANVVHTVKFCFEDAMEDVGSRGAALLFALTRWYAGGSSVVLYFDSTLPIGFGPLSSAATASFQAALSEYNCDHR